MYRAVSSFCRIDLPLMQALPLLHGAEPTTIEVFCEAPHLDPAGEWPQIIADLRRYGHDHELRYALHAPCFDLNPAAANAGVRHEVLRQYRWAIDRAVDLGAEQVVIHSGQRSDPRLDAGVARGYTRTLLEDIVPYAAAAGVRLALENTGYGSVSLLAQPHDLSDLIDDLPAATVGLTLDIGHAHLQGFDMQDTVANWTTRLVNVHLHDNVSGDDHLPPGSGVVPIAAALAALHEQRYAGPMVLESFLGGSLQTAIGTVWAQPLFASVAPSAP